MKLSKDPDGKWIWSGGFETRHIPKAAKFRWNPETKTWWTDQITTAVTLLEFAEGDDLVELTNMKNTMDGRLADSSATDSDIEVPIPDGKEYYGYQKAGIAYALKNKNVLIADDMGLGKTVQAIGVINSEPSINRVLIVCPSSLKHNWRKELEAWLTRDLSTAILTTKNTQPIDRDILIINYDILASEKMKWVSELDYDLIIADEAHKVKNKKAKRSAAYYALAKKVDRKLMLTGTPILNRPIELFYIIESLGFDMDYWRYARRYCDAKKTKGFWDMSGSSNLEELQMKLRQTIMVRRQKADVLTELPPKRRQIIELDPEKYKDYIEAEQDLLNGVAPGFKSEDYEPDSNLDDFEARVGSLREMSAADVAEIAKLRHQTALAKVPDVVEHLKGVLEEVDKVIVFAHHRDVLTSIHEAFNGSSVILMGGMKDDDKDMSVTKFQTDPDIRVFVGSIQAAGVGLTLTAASVVIFAELDWVPANLTQAEDRAHRIGQTDSVLVQHIVIDGSIDSTLAKRIVGKQNIIDKALNVNKLNDHREEQANKLADVVNAAKAEIDRAKEISEEQVTRKGLHSQVPGISDEDKSAILKKLKYLASVCDYAVGVDGHGFNKFDAVFGHVLAAKNELTDQQAHAAMKMLQKYRGQFEEIKI